MKWKAKYGHHDERIVEKFAWYPISIKKWDKREVRWLCRVKYKQIYYAFNDSFFTDLNGGRWENLYFID